MADSRAVPTRKALGLLALAVAAGIAGWFFWTRVRLRPPDHPLRVALMHSPPYEYVYDDGSVGGFAVEVVGEAARRRGFPLEWVVMPPDPETLLPAGKVDLWAALSITPERQKRFYLTQPYLQNEFCLVARARTEQRSSSPAPVDTTGRTVAMSSSPVRRSMVAKLMPRAKAIHLPDRRAVIQAVCRGATDYGFLETRVVAEHALVRPPGCESVDLAMLELPGAIVPIGTGAAPHAIGYADAIRDEIGKMAADGTLASFYSKWLVGSNASIDEYLDLIEGERRERILTWGIALLSVIFAFTLWQVRRVRSARRAAEAANAFKSQFLANMSHEMRTPLNGVIGMTSLLAAMPLGAEQREYVRTIQRASELLLSLISEVLDFSKIEAGRLFIESTDLNLRTLIVDCTQLVAPEAARKRLILRHEIGPETPALLRGDPVRIRQVLLNLLSNAVKFTTSGEVVVGIEKLEQKGGMVSIRFHVKDTGIGISPEAKQRLFQAFTQADESTTRRYGGTGLGLAISKRLVELMGGEMNLESVPGAGSTFSFTLIFPVVSDAATPLERTAVPPLELFEARILLAEDNEVNQRVGVLLLTRLGCKVDVAINGIEAIEAFRRAHYDVVFLDCQMPEMDGYAAAGKIRELEGQRRRTPIIAMTANVVQGDRERCLASGMDDYVSKPVRIEDLVAALRRSIPAPEPATKAG